LLGAGGAVAVALVVGVYALGPFGLTASPTLQKQLHLLLLFAPSLIADLPFRLLANLLIAERKARHSAVIQVARTIMIALSTLVPLASEADVDLVIHTSAVVRWAFGLVVLWELRALYGAAARVPSPLSVRGLFAVAVPIGATEVISQLNAQLDRWLVLLVLPTTRLADYQAGAWQVPVIGTIAYSVGAAFTPNLVERFRAQDPAGALAIWRKNADKVALIVVPTTMALVVAADELMTVLFTSAYADAANIFRFYSPLTFLRIATFGPLIVTAGRPRLSLVAAAFGLLYNVVLSVPLVYSVGFLGPAMGTGFAFLLHVATYVFFISRATGLPYTTIFPMRTYLRIFGVASAAGALGWLVKLEVPLPIVARLVAEIVVVLVAFVLIGLATRTLKREDLAYLRTWMRRNKTA